MSFFCPRGLAPIRASHFAVCTALLLALAAPARGEGVLKSVLKQKGPPSRPVPERAPSDAAQRPASSGSAADRSGPAVVHPNEPPRASLVEEAPAPRPGATARELLREAHRLSRTAKLAADYGALIDVCRQALQRKPEPRAEAYAQKLLSWAHNRRGEARVGQGDEEAALDDFEAAVSHDPTRWRARHNRAISYALAGRQQDALSDLNRTIELNPKFADALFNRGELRCELGQLEAALADYSRAIDLEPNDAATRNARGHASYRLGRLDEALADYDASIRLDPGRPEVLTNRGDLFTERGEYDKAAKDYRAAVRLDPQLPRARQSVAWLMATCPNPRYRSKSGAIDNARYGLRLIGQNDPQYLDTLAAAYANAGDFAQARETIERAIDTAPPRLARHLKGRLKLYEAGTALRISPRAASLPRSPRQEVGDARQASHEEQVPPIQFRAIDEARVSWKSRDRVQRNGLRSGVRLHGEAGDGFNPIRNGNGLDLRSRVNPFRPQPESLDSAADRRPVGEQQSTAE